MLREGRGGGERTWSGGEGCSTLLCVLQWQPVGHLLI